LQAAVLIAAAIAIAQGRPSAQADAFVSFHSSLTLNTYSHVLPALSGRTVTLIRSSLAAAVTFTLV
jgi:hypothetical protein